MTPTQREAALRLADYWSADSWPGGLSGTKMDKTAALLRELAAEPVQEPVATVGLSADMWKGYGPTGQWFPPGEPLKTVHLLRDLPIGTLLYANPQQQRKPLSDSDLLKLARRCLWLAYVWNDHNFQKPPHKYAQDEAKALGIDSFEDANEWLVDTHAEITGEKK